MIIIVNADALRLSQYPRHVHAPTEGSHFCITPKHKSVSPLAFLNDDNQASMDVPTHDTIGLNIYRELIGRANRSVGTWEKRYGKEVAVLPLPPQSPTCSLLILWSAPLGRH